MRNVNKQRFRLTWAMHKVLNHRKSTIDWRDVIPMALFPAQVQGCRVIQFVSISTSRIFLLHSTKRLVNAPSREWWNPWNATPEMEMESVDIRSRQLFRSYVFSRQTPDPVYKYRLHMKAAGDASMKLYVNLEINAEALNSGPSVWIGSRSLLRSCYQVIISIFFLWNWCNILLLRLLILSMKFSEDSTQASLLPN